SVPTAQTSDAAAASTPYNAPTLTPPGATYVSGLHGLETSPTVLLLPPHPTGRRIKNTHAVPVTSAFTSRRGVRPELRLPRRGCAGAGRMRAVDIERRLLQKERPSHVPFGIELAADLPGDPDVFGRTREREIQLDRSGTERDKGEGSHL